MADAPKSLWSKWIEGGSDNLTSIEPAKRACPHDRSSCAKTLIGGSEGSPKSPGKKCHPECPEPRRPLQPEEFCPELGKVKPPPPKCCFIRMQDPCAPCCCPPPEKCEDECRPGPKRDPICGCDLCKKKQCPDGKCCGPTEPSCQKAVRKCNSESQTIAECSIKPPEMKVCEVYSHPELPCDFPVCRCKKNDISILELIRRSFDWLLCTPLKIPIPHIEWRSIGDPEHEKGQRDSSVSACSREKKRSHSPSWKAGDCCRRPYLPDFSNRSLDGPKYSRDNRSCECGPCRVRRLFEGPCVKREETGDGNKHVGNCHKDDCDCRPCRVRRALEKPIR